jgi:ABC-type transport system substrate-binding protein
MAIRRRGLLKSGLGTAAALALSGGDLRAQQARTLLLGEPETPAGFDGDALRPGTQKSVVQIYEGLVRYGRVQRNGRTYLDPNTIVPHLAEKWERLDGGRRYVFTLRAGVKSPYGNEMSAADVEWGWAKSIAQKRTGAFIANVCNVTGVKALSQREVEFTFSAPSSIFLPCLTLYLPGVYDTTEVKRHTAPDDPWALHWMETNTAGYGAYNVESVRPGEQCVFVANPNYFGDKPFFQRVIWRAIPSGASRITLLRTGQLHWIDRPNVQQVMDLKNDKRVALQDTEGRAMASVRMNNRFKPFDDVRVRRAFNFAIDQESLVQSVFLGAASPAKSVVPPIVGSYDPSGFAYGHDLPRARALLAEAGYGSGLEVELLFSNLFWWEEPMAIQVAAQLKPAGVTVKLQRIPAADMAARSAIGRQDMPFFTYEDGPIVLDPVYTLSLLADSKGPSNRAAYNNPQLDALIAGSKVSLDPVERDANMRKAQKLWVDDAPWILTVYQQVWQAMAPGITGWVPHPDDHERWADLKMS